MRHRDCTIADSGDPTRLRVEVDPVGRAKVRLETPVRAVTPGQAAVFYEGERVLGGGWIA